MFHRTVSNRAHAEMKANLPKYFNGKLLDHAEKIAWNFVSSLSSRKASSISIPGRNISILYRMYDEIDDDVGALGHAYYYPPVDAISINVSTFFSDMKIYDYSGISHSNLLLSATIHELFHGAELHSGPLADFSSRIQKLRKSGVMRNHPSFRRILDFEYAFKEGKPHFAESLFLADAGESKYMAAMLERRLYDVRECIIVLRAAYADLKGSMWGALEPLPGELERLGAYPARMMNLLNSYAYPIRRLP